MTREQRRDAWIDRMRQQRGSTATSHVARATDAAHSVSQYGVRQVSAAHCTATGPSLRRDATPPRTHVCYGVVRTGLGSRVH